MPKTSFVLPLESQRVSPWHWSCEACPARRLGIVQTFRWLLENHSPRVDPAFGKHRREVETEVTEQLIADILAIKHRQDRAAEAALREKAERTQAEEELKKSVAKRWAALKSQLLDSATLLNTAFKSGGIEINFEEGQVGTSMLDFMHIRVARDGREAGRASLNIDKVGGAQFTATIRGARRHEPWDRKIAAEQMSLEPMQQVVLDFVRTVIEKAGR
jgi:hypothetical protein